MNATSTLTRPVPYTTGYRGFESRQHCDAVMARWLRGEGGGDEFGLPETDQVAALRMSGTLARQLEQRAVTTGEYLTPGDRVFSTVLDRLQRLDPVLRVCTIVTGDREQNHNVPNTDDVANAGALIAENGAIGDAPDFVFGQKQLKLYKFSSRMLKASTELVQDAETFVTSIGDLLGARIARGTGPMTTSGTGSSQPEGVLAAAANSSVTYPAAAPPTVAALLDLADSVDYEYHESPACGYMMHPTVWTGILKSFSNPTTFVMPRMPVDDGPDMPIANPRFNGFPVFLNRHMPTVAAEAKTVLFGDFSRYIARVDRDFELRVVRQRYAENMQIGYIGVLRLGAALCDPAAIKYAAHAA